MKFPATIKTWIRDLLEIGDPQSPRNRTTAFQIALTDELVDHPENWWVEGKSDGSFVAKHNKVKHITLVAGNSKFPQVSFISAFGRSTKFTDANARFIWAALNDRHRERLVEEESAEQARILSRLRDGVTE